MQDQEALDRVSAARVARLATAGAGGVPHVVPVVFVVQGETLYWAVDGKPKRSRRLKRIDNIEANPNVDVIVDHYEEDWTRVWWVRLSGTARILSEGPERGAALGALTQKYPQYRTDPPSGPVVAIDVVRWTSWHASGR